MSSRFGQAVRCAFIPIADRCMHTTPAALSPRLLAAPGATIDHFARAVDDFLVLLIRRKRQAGSRPTSTR